MFFFHELYLFKENIRLLNNLQFKFEIRQSLGDNRSVEGGKGNSIKHTSECRNGHSHKHHKWSKVTKVSDTYNAEMMKNTISVVMNRQPRGKKDPEESPMNGGRVWLEMI